MQIMFIVHLNYRCDVEGGLSKELDDPVRCLADTFREAVEIASALFNEDEGDFFKVSVEDSSAGLFSERSLFYTPTYSSEGDADENGNPLEVEVGHICALPVMTAEEARR